MFCKQCLKSVLIRQYRVFHFGDEGTRTEYTTEYFNSLEEAENYYEDILKKYPNIEWALTELLICNDCDYVDEKILKGEKV